MEGPRTKRRKLEREENTTQTLAANNYDHERNQSNDLLARSKALIAREHDMCFGMIRIEAKTLRPDALGADGESFVEISLNLEENQLFARNIATQAYGGLFGRQHRSTQALKDLHEHHKATLGAWLIRTDASTRKKPVYELFIVVHGMQSQTDVISDVLDRAQLFLQDSPHQVRGDQSVPYFNPHRLYNPASGSGMKPAPKHALSDSVKSVKSQQALRDTDPLRQRVQEVMDSACGPEYPAISHQSPRIRTLLKSHQMKALSMMIEKESGNIDNNVFGSVWKAMKHHDSIKYKNSVTGSVQTNFPKLCHGGVLADDMGLGKTLTTISLIAASKDFTHFGAQNSSSPRTTLIVTPLSLLQTWEEQLLNHVHPGQLSYCRYYGAFRGSISSLADYDAVLTTYDTVSNEGPKNSRDKFAGLGLVSTEWLRVVLDEAHVIRNRSTKRYRAIHSLKARFRWCLTGTPIFNRVEDLGSLMGFLGVHPFDSAAMFNSRVADPVVKGLPHGIKTLRKLIHATSLRRTKDSILDELHLPGRIVLKELVQLTGEEQRDYDVLKTKYASILRENDGTNDSSRPTASAMQTIARLRQFCDHGLDLLPKKVYQLFENSTNSKNLAWSLFSALEECAVCPASASEDSSIQESLDCGHSLCYQCQTKISDGSILADIVCKLCDREMTKSSSASPCPGTNSAVASDDYVPSSKVQSLLRNLMSAHQSDPYSPIKSVVFTCWTRMLDLIQKALIIQGLDFVRIDGSKTEKARREAITRFREDRNCGILLATIGSAGVGLDLTVASRVHIIEPQWTQTAENQAIDRVHRLGQTRDVIATRYIVQNSIEEYVLSVQDRKSAIMRQAFEMGGVENVMSARERLLQYLT